MVVLKVIFFGASSVAYYHEQCMAFGVVTKWKMGISEMAGMVLQPDARRPRGG